MMIMNILTVAILFTIIIAIAMVVLLDKKKESQRRLKCTIAATGTLVRVNQIFSSMSSEDGYVDYSYYPVVRYEYNGQVYETEYNFSSERWNRVEVNTPLDIFINPEDGNDIYIPIPDTVKGGKK